MANNVFLELVLSRNSQSIPWGFTLSGGKDQGITLKVGCVLQDSVADSCGLRGKDFIWKIGGTEVFGKTHAECVRMIKNCGNSIQMTVERGDHIVPNFHELAGRNGSNGVDLPRRRETGKKYYLSAMQSHGLPGKIPTSFTTVGKPYFENLQYNSPIDIYDDDTVDEMVKIMNNAGAINQAVPAVNQASPAVNLAVPAINQASSAVNQAAAAVKIKTDYDDEPVSNLGWSVRTSTKTLIKPNPNNFQTASKSVAWSSDM